MALGLTSGIKLSITPVTEHTHCTLYPNTLWFLQIFSL